ncbi:MAG: preprotein translocase subunit SecE [Coriobacteriia bacterium]|nr:preprotein translocase subunit SecE [Coriobacteriia bacterium]
MAKKKKRKANKPKPAAAPSTDKLAKDKAEFEASVEAEKEKSAKEKAAKEKAASTSKKEAKVSDKDQDKEKGKDKGKTVVKSQARAKDPVKAQKKPNIFRRFFNYLKQVRLEIKRTTWPTGNEVVNMSIIVFVALLFFGTFIFLIDLALVELLALYGHLIPTAEVDIISGLDELPDFEELGDSDLGEAGAAAIKLFKGLDFSGIKAFFGGE